MDLNLLPNNAMTFSENQHGNAVLEKLKMQRDKSRYCDVILHIDGKKHFAHRCVLSACSPFFDSFFKANKTVREQITISAQSSEVVLILLTYMYTGTVTIDTKNVSDLLKLADTFLLCKLKEYCVEYLQRYLDTRNCLTIWEMANRFGLDSLQKNASSHIAIHLEDVLDGEEILGITQTRLESFITNSSWHFSNERILTLITSWVSHTPETRESSFRSLLTFVSWKQLNPETVVNLLQIHPLFATSKKCRSFVMDVLSENNLLSDLAYKKLEDLKDSDTEKLNLEDDNDSFINMAITTAINESNVEKYFMDSRRDLLKVDLSLSEQSHYESSVMEESSDPTPEDRPVNRNNVVLHNKLESTPHSDSTTLQTIDLEELCKYTLENTQKQRSYLSEAISESDRVSPTWKDCDNEQCSYGDNGCLQYKEFREGDHFKTQNKGCPKFTNKISYMNYKYDVNHSTVNDSFNTKNSTDSFNFSSPTHLLDFSKDGALNLMSGNYTEDHLCLHISQENQYQSVEEPLSPIGYKAEQFAVTEDIVSDVKEVFPDRNVNLNAMAYMKANCVSTSQPEFLYMDCSNDTQSSNNYPKDMSLSYLKLNELHNAQEFYHNKDEFHNSTQEFYQNENNAFPEGATNDLQVIDNNVKVQNDHSTSSCGNLQQSYDNSNDISHNIHSFENKSYEMNQENDGIQITTPQTSEKDKRSEDHIGIVVEKKEKCSSKKSEKKKRINEKKGSKRKKKKEEIAPEPAKVFKTCDICGANFEKKRTYFVHMIEHFKGPPFCCDNCESKFQRIYHLLDHRLKHLDKKQFECTHAQCTFATNKMFNLKEHLVLHTSEKPFKCDECGDSFSRKQYLIVHMTRHTSERPLICETCGWSAKTKNSLLTHSKIHSGDLYSCQYSDCPYRTAKKSHLKEHMRFHTKSRPFACKFCGIRFITKAHVMRHSRKHETPNLHQCKQCDYCAPRIDSLKRHIKQKHSTTKPKLRFRTGQLRKKDALLSNKKIEISPSSEQIFTPNLNSSNRLSPNSLPLLSESFSQYQSPSPSHSDCTFGAPGDPDDPLTIVSEMEDTHSPYLNNIGQAFSGLLDSSCGADRFNLTSTDELYYT